MKTSQTLMAAAALALFANTAAAEEKKVEYEPAVQELVEVLLGYDGKSISQKDDKTVYQIKGLPTLNRMDPQGAAIPVSDSDLKIRLDLVRYEDAAPLGPSNGDELRYTLTRTTDGVQEELAYVVRFTNDGVDRYEVSFHPGFLQNNDHPKFAKNKDLQIALEAVAGALIKFEEDLKRQKANAEQTL